MRRSPAPPRSHGQTLRCDRNCTCGPSGPQVLASAAYDRITTLSPVA